MPTGTVRRPRAQDDSCTSICAAPSSEGNGGRTTAAIINVKTSMMASRVRASLTGGYSTRSMKYAALLLAITFPLAPRAQETTYPLRVMTFNIMVEFSILPHIPEWPERKYLVAQVIKEHAPDILGVQEATSNQLAFLQAELPQYASHGSIPLERI